MEKFQQSWWTLSQNQIQYPNQKKLYMIWKLDTGKHGYLKGSRLNRITENNLVTKENNLQQRCTNSFIRNLYASHVIKTTQFSLPLKLNVGQKKTTTTNKQNSSLIDIVKPVEICYWWTSNSPNCWRRLRICVIGPDSACKTRKSINPPPLFTHCVCLKPGTPSQLREQKLVAKEHCIPKIYISTKQRSRSWQE